MNALRSPCASGASSAVLCAHRDVPGRQAKIEHLVADGNADAHRLAAAAAPERAEWQVLNREVGGCVVG
jgi:hypothetical protein